MIDLICKRRMLWLGSKRASAPASALRTARPVDVTWLRMLRLTAGVSASGSRRRRTAFGTN